MNTKTTDVEYHFSERSLPKQAAVDSLPIFAAYFPLGVVWGILWEQAGLPPVWGVIFSACAYAGAAQFIALSLLASEISPWGLAITILPVAIRNSFYTITALHRLPSQWLCRLYSAFGLVDTTFAIVMSKPIEQAKNPWYNIPLSLIIQSYWVIGTLVGVYGGSYIPNGVASLNFTLPALLAILAFDQYRKIRSLRPVVIPILTASVTWVLLGDAWLIPALVVCTVAAVTIKSEEHSS